jgi:hypothetical protein
VGTATAAFAASYAPLFASSDGPRGEDEGEAGTTVTTTTSTTSAATSAKHKGKARRPEALLVLDIGHAGVSALPIVRDHAMLCHLQLCVPPPPIPFLLLSF